MPRQLLAAGAVALPGALIGAGAYLGLPVWHPGPYAAAALYGSAIVGAAFLLVWAAEAAQVDISAGLALAVLALLAVLPEYAVDFVFSYRAGQTFEETGQCAPPEDGGADPCSLALANMTGANRILVGVGWPLIVLVATVAAVRDRRAAAASVSVVEPGRVRLRPPMAAETAFLGIATLYSLTLPLKDTLTLWDAGVLIAVFALYVRRLAGAPARTPDLIGTAAWLGRLDRVPRRLAVGGLFLFAGLVVLATAEHFAEGLVDTGTQAGISHFVLVQWVAPLASESPEFVVASIYAWRLKASAALGTLLSSKVNQWTLLVGTIPIVFALASSGLHGLPIDENQRVELLLTAAQSLFAVALLVDLQLSLWGAGALLVLFSSQFAASVTLGADTNRLIALTLSGVYLAAGAAMLLHRFRRTAELARDGTVRPFEQLEQEDLELEQEAEAAVASERRAARSG
jgi:cation:H+ antiporter